MSEIGIVQQVDIDNEMREAYLDYAMSVIVARAIPDVRDGLKPVHRRILYAMRDMGIRANTPHRKSARIVGEVLGKYHPHGDMAVYDAMARMAQDFSMRYPMVDGQGNFGSIDGDSPAAMRYTEARLAQIAEEMLIDLNKETVDFIDNFDGALQEPMVLPSRLPNLLLNGSSGIAVGMATNVPPHNLRELVAALNHLIDRYDDMDDVSVETLMEYLPGPDFPTGGMIIGDEGIRLAYSTGRGRIIMRGTATIEEKPGDKFVITITEIPYQLNKTTLIERIAELVREGRLDSISDMRDESDRTGMRIVIELKRGAQPKRVLNQLYKYTPLQSTFGAQILALVNEEPRLLPLKRALQFYLEHRQEVITRRTQYDLDKAKARAHILEGLLIALANLDEVIQTIRESDDAETAKERLMTRFKLSDPQAQAILDMQLRRLAALERQKIMDEHKDVMTEIEYLEDLLANPKKILEIIRTDLNEIAEKYGDERRTVISPDASSDLSEEALVKKEDVLVSITRKGYVKRVSETTYRSQGRGGRGVIGQSMRDEDEVEFFLRCHTLSVLLFFTNKGKVYSEKVWQLPEESRTGRGISIVNVINIAPNEKITAVVPVADFEDAKYCTMATVSGRVKRVELSEFETVRPSGLIAITLDEQDQLGWVSLTSGKDEIMLITRNGQALRFNEELIRPMGRQAMGVIGIRTRPGDQLAALEVLEPNGDLLVVTDKGFGKRTKLSEYTPKGRATMGIATIDKRALKSIGKIAEARVVQEKDEVSLISSNGIVIRMAVADISTQGRATRGVTIMNLESRDSVAAMARIPFEKEAPPEELEE
ncbi:MAG: DNA gyrase subunit A [Brevefilum sp.]|nr:DNA gyrase subunit A [Brevefilum sp.]MDT8382467.1 DNA gyrase subunit A [Brevefilum sp.]MDW7755421.1 DNA gyrase subunit A [Brevefilum sp.]